MQKGFPDEIGSDHFRLRGLVKIFLGEAPFALYAWINPLCNVKQENWQRQRFVFFPNDVIKALDINLREWLNVLGS
jgi:hypothetical protein